MPRYRFALKKGLDTIGDLDGEEFPDDVTARNHALVVARELMRNNERQARYWRMEVQDQNSAPIDTIHFISTDQMLDELPSGMRESIESFHRSSASLSDAVVALRVSVRQLRATLARAEKVPYLASLNGETLL